ncbi:MAG: GTPase HflX, partial [Pseudomonadota bacterium]|nr:GTPase HflX [Pseudomonadota bacterium]
MLDRPTGGERAILVHLELGKASTREDSQEFAELVLSAGAELVAWVTGSRQQPEVSLYVGSGKAEEIRLAVIEHNADLVIFNHTLTPSQERNLEKILQCRVLDRTGLILDIFAQRARTFEGKLQVELAQLEHSATRLVRGWTHLERQKGGIGLRGPGETQLESDRRLLRNRVKLIKSRLEKVRTTRAQSRQYRHKQAVPTIVLVGYTNAGKSTLFNALTTSDVYTADQLFATLDPTLRQIKIQDVGDVIIADTVGFIRHLPHQLVESFRATLEEAVYADLLVHVVDAANPDKVLLIDAVNEVLKEIGAADVPQLIVSNKIDLLEGAQANIEYDVDNVPIKVRCSAKTGEGVALISQAIGKRLPSDLVWCDVILGPAEGALRAALYELDGVLADEPQEEG